MRKKNKRNSKKRQGLEADVKHQPVIDVAGSDDYEVERGDQIVERRGLGDKKLVKEVKTVKKFERLKDWEGGGPNERITEIEVTKKFKEGSRNPNSVDLNESKKFLKHKGMFTNI